MGLELGLNWKAGSNSTLAELFYRHVDPADLDGREPAALTGCVHNLLVNAALRPPGSAVVVAANPAPGQGWSVGRTVVNVITADMPFLVDSVAAELTRLEVGIHMLVHPVVVATRDASGRLLEFAPLPSGDPDSPAAAPTRAAVASPVGPPQLESWMHIEVDWQADREAMARIETCLQTVLQDVSRAVTDWPKMVQAAHRVSAELAATRPVGVPAWEVDEAVEVLAWLADDHFTFLGYRPYRVEATNGDIRLVAPPGSGLGILRSEQAESTAFAALPEQVRARAREPHPLILTKANRRSTVHRAVYLDYVGIKMFDPDGQVVGEHRFLGLFAASTYTSSVSKIPVISRKARELRAALGVRKGSHSGRDLQQFLETFPRDELFAAEPEFLRQVAEFTLGMHERRATRLFVRRDPYQRFLSCLVYLPRDRYNTDVRLRIQDALLTATGGANVEYTARVTESVLARLHVVVRMARGQSVPELDLAALEAQVARIARSWADDLAEELKVRDAQGSARLLLAQYPGGFPEAYKEATAPAEAITDLQVLESLDTPGAPPLSASLLPAAAHSGAQANLRLKLYALAEISLARVLPLLDSLGVEVVTERPFQLARIGRDGEPGTAGIYDFGLRVADPAAVLGVRRQWQQALVACWRGLAEPDTLNRLVVGAGLTWQEVVVLRAYCHYLRQAGSAFSQSYVHAALIENPLVARQLIAVFANRLDPAVAETLRVESGLGLAEQLEDQLDAVASLDHDRILRSLRGLITATLRTNYYQPDRPAIAFKLDPAAIPELPEPRPKFEICVYSPRVTGVHLRFGPVARGGLRWSDRREDYRTEVLGLVKAQAVKNAVIVPVGAKGGFFAKALPAPTAREAWLAEGQAAYREFIGSLLDLTDNLVAGAVVPPPNVVRHDGDDSYLVVAADKGTATFSDIANEVAARYQYWLGDAFASGGSAGYDHKAMGITARGAWESVKAHFRALGRDLDRHDFTCVGIGDMSGDVFGNGMLRSRHLKLVAAFDHRHIFLDPDPDPVVSFAERQRLFGLPRSTWADYDRSLISAGGGVHPRSAKSVPISQQVARRLGLPADVVELTPSELLRAVLTAPVDLLWNGGIGTYVKASSETDAAAGDRANDAIRVNGNQLRVRVVGEGGNLGLTQLGRIEAAGNGVLLNTDAIDNSAGVDTSDHEVNIKILLDHLVVAGRLAREQRVPLLESMTDEVARLVLRHNVEANVLISVEAQQAAGMLPAIARLMHDLEARGELARDLEALPDDAALAGLVAAGRGLSRPELAVVLAYVKLGLKEQLLDSRVPDERWSLPWLTNYFPAELRARFADQFEGHPLRRQIIATGLVNEMVNQGGITYVMRTVEETGATAAEVARAYAVACSVFGLPGLWSRISASAGRSPEVALNALRIEVTRLLDRATRWLLQNRGGTLLVDAEAARFAPEVSRLAGQVPGLLLGVEQDRLRRRAGEFVAAGAPADLAAEVAALLDVFSLLDIVEVARGTNSDAAEVAAVYFTLSERYAVDLYLVRITKLPRDDRWTSLARSALRSDLYGALAALTDKVIRATPNGGAPLSRVLAWEARYAEGLGRARATLDQIGASESFDLATLSVAMRVMRTLAGQGN